MTVRQLLGGRYQFIKTLGSDLEGNTCLVADTFLPEHPKCVVKRLSLPSKTPKAMRFILVLLKKKAEALKHVGSHDQIPKILAYFEENNNFYLVEQFVPGRPLSDVLKPRQRFSEAVVRQLLREILKILLVVHSWGVIHRCIKPSNIIQRQLDGKLVLTGFGIFKEISQTGRAAPITDRIGSHGSATSGSSRRHTHALRKDTSIYIPPDLAKGQRHFSSDLYAVGMIGIQALTGLSQEELSQLRRAQIQSESAIPESLSWHTYTQVSPELRAILDRMISFSPERRYKAATEVLEDLDHTEVLPPPSDEATPAPEPSRINPPVQSSEATPESSTKSLRRGRGRAVSIAAIALLALIVGAFFTRMPQRLWALHALQQGHQLESIGDRETAIAQYTRSITSFPTADAYLQRGMAYYEADEWRLAQEDLTRAIELNDGSNQAFYHRGNVRFGLGDYQGALEDYTEAIRLNPKAIKAYVNRGSVRAELGDDHGAIDDYTAAIRHEPNLAAAYLNRCLSRSNLGQHQEAIADCTQAIRIEPNSLEAYQNRGLVRRRLGDTTGAIEDFNIAINLDPDDADPYYNRGLARLEVGDEVGAIADYSQAIELDPSHALAYYDRGMIYQAQENWEDAIADLEKSAKLCLDAGRMGCYDDAQYQLRQIQSPTQPPMRPLSSTRRNEPTSLDR